MQEQLISFETAKLTKEKRFDLYCNFVYKLNKEFRQVVYYEGTDDNYNEGFVKNSEIEEYQFSEEIFTAPTQSLIQKWLREKHNIHIETEYKWEYDYYVFHIGRAGKIARGLKGFKTYEEALEKGLQEALKLI